jgi:hypothetical protein
VEDTATRELPGASGIKAGWALADARVYWLIVLAFVAYASEGQPNTPEFLLPIGCALVAGGVALAAAGYRWNSFVTILVVAHVVAFPIGAWLIMSLVSPSPWIEPDIWPNTPLGMWAMVVGMLGLATGALISRLRLRTRHRGFAPDSAITTPRLFNLALTALAIPVVAIYLSLGIYYHKDATGIDSYDFGNASTFGFVGYLLAVSYVGTVLQVRRYVITRASLDKWAAILSLVVPFLLLAPSGSRATALLGSTIAILAFLGWESRARVKWVVLLAGALTFSVIVPLMETYRLTAQSAGELSFLERTVMALRFARGATGSDESDLAPDLARGMLGRRLSDHHSVGYIIEMVPKTIPHRGAAGMMHFPLFVVPTLIRPQTALDYNYDAQVMENYGFRTEIGGSSPMMLLGELYDRFGWFGIFIGMAIIGVAMTAFDRWAARGGIRETVLWVLFAQGIVNVHTYSLLKDFTLVTRQAAIFLVLAIAIERIVNGRATPRWAVQPIEG